MNDYSEIETVVPLRLGYSHSKGFDFHREVAPKLNPSGAELSALRACRRGLRTGSNGAA